MHDADTSAIEQSADRQSREAKSEDRVPDMEFLLARAILSHTLLTDVEIDLLQMRVVANKLGVASPLDDRIKE